jgi:hypothetical protein
VAVIGLNIYFLAQLYFQHQNQSDDDQLQQQLAFREPERFNGGNQPIRSTSNDFLVLDWTGHQHIFREHDPIQCK